MPLGDSMDDVFGLVGQRLSDKYMVESAVAQGGFGLVYRARHVTLQKALAVKVLLVPDELSESARGEFMRLFLQEAQMIAHLDHPAIVRVLDSGVSRMPAGEDAPWMVLDWIDGETLDAHLEARRGAGGRPPAEVLTVLRPALDALAYAHDLGVAHRDIKPANMMLPSANAGGTRRLSQHGIVGLRLLDFGIAKVMEADEQAGAGKTRTRSRHTAYSPPYAAPEQVGAARTGPWTDVHAMALIVTEALTDQPAYTSRDPTELAGEALSRQRPTPGAKGIDVGAWEPILARALALRAADRFATAGELLAALEAALPGATHQRVASAPTDARPVFSATIPASVVVPVMPEMAAPAEPAGTLYAAVLVEPSTSRRKNQTVRFAAGLAALLVLGGALSLALRHGGNAHLAASVPVTPVGVQPEAIPPAVIQPAVIPPVATPPTAVVSPSAPSVPALQEPAVVADAPTLPAVARPARPGRGQRHRGVTTAPGLFMRSVAPAPNPPTPAPRAPARTVNHLGADQM